MKDLTNRNNLHEAQFVLEMGHDWRGWIDKIPFFSFPSKWKVQVIPPVGGALARFRVKDKSDGLVSVYLDGYCLLGFFAPLDTPYWEVYPYEGDVFRCDMNDTDALIKAIGESLEQQRKTSHD